jgi:uncharacterized membrane protein YdjX (TVP38/TMEM64 family)
MDEELHDFNVKWHRWHYKNTLLLVLSLILFYLLIDFPIVRETIDSIGKFGYIGAFFVGMLYVSVFTIAPAAVLLFDLAHSLDPIGIAFVAGTGSLITDYLLFRYMKDAVFTELQPLFQHYGGKPLKLLFKSPFFAWMLPILGALIIASPLPDELGIGLLGLSKVKTWQFIVLAFIMDVSGIFVTVLLARLF